MNSLLFIEEFTSDKASDSIWCKYADDGRLYKNKTIAVLPTVTVWEFPRWIVFADDRLVFSRLNQALFIHSFVALALLKFAYFSVAYVFFNKLPAI